MEAASVGSSGLPRRRGTVASPSAGPLTRQNLRRRAPRGLPRRRLGAPPGAPRHSRPNGIPQGGRLGCPKLIAQEDCLDRTTTAADTARRRGAAHLVRHPAHDPRRARRRGAGRLPRRRVHRPLREAALPPGGRDLRRPVRRRAGARGAAGRAVADDPHLHGAGMGRRCRRADHRLRLARRRGRGRAVGGDRGAGRPDPVLRPRRGVRPSADADWPLLAGDESALPAIGAALERLPGGARALVFVEVAGPEEEQTDLAVGDGVELRWVHRGDAAPGEALVAEVRGAALPAGTGSLFVHGEAGAVRELRRHLRDAHGLPRELTSISGYWRRGDTEDRWQATKREWNAAIEAEEAPAPAHTAR